MSSLKISDSYVISTEQQPNSIGSYGQTPVGFTGARVLPTLSRKGQLYDLTLKKH